MRYIRTLFLVIVKLLSPVYFLIFRPNRKLLTIFLYHDIGDAPSEFASAYHLNVSNKNFQKQVNWINRHFNIIHPRDLVDNKKLPDYPALITFDDGFAGAFENGINHLCALNIPSLMFLNMYCITTGCPLLSAIACFLAEKSPEFEEFAAREKITKPYHLTLTPYYYDLFLKEKGIGDISEIRQYQGTLADMSVIKKFGDSDCVVYGNHLFDHWNATALTDDAFTDSYIKNAGMLDLLPNSMNLFAFPNGQPGTCFTQKNVDALRTLRTDKAFYSSGGVNNEGVDFLLNRTALTEFENSERKLWNRYHIARIYGTSRLMQSRIK